MKNLKIDRLQNTTKNGCISFSIKQKNTAILDMFLQTLNKQT